MMGGEEDYTECNADYDDEYYDYYYSSRVRLFQRPYTRFNYYDPVYVDVNYYDPFYQPGTTTVLIYKLIPKLVDHKSPTAR